MAVQKEPHTTVPFLKAHEHGGRMRDANEDVEVPTRKLVKLVKFGVVDAKYLSAADSIDTGKAAKKS